MFSGVTLPLGIFLILYLILKKISVQNIMKSKSIENVSTNFVN